MNKKLLSLVLALVMCLGLCAPAFASNNNAAPAEEVETENAYVIIEAGKTEGKDSQGNTYQLSNPVIRVEEGEYNSGKKYTYVVVPVGTVVTVTKADGTQPESMFTSDYDNEWAASEKNPYTMEYVATWEFSIAEDISFIVKTVEADEAGDTTPADPDAKPDETKPEDAKPDETKPEETKPDETKPDETKPEETKPEETTPDEPKPVENPFTDVKEGDYFYEPVLWAVEKEITKGTTETTFTPGTTCSVTEILTFLWRAAGSPEPTIENPYENVDAESWFGPAVIWAYEKEMGVTEDLLTADCTRASTAVYLWKAAGSPEAEKAAEFTDVAADANYAAAVAWAVEKGVTTGTSDTTFSPEDVCTRGQIATFLYRAFADGDQQ